MIYGEVCKGQGKLVILISCYRVEHSQFFQLLVPERRFELLHLAALAPETSASTNSAIRATTYWLTATILNKIFLRILPKIRLLDFLVRSMSFKVRIILLENQTFGIVLFVFRRCVP